jgi:hypothetical protein
MRAKALLARCCIAAKHPPFPLRFVPAPGKTSIAKLWAGIIFELQVRARRLQNFLSTFVIFSADADAIERATRTLERNVRPVAAVQDWNHRH